MSFGLIFTQAFLINVIYYQYPDILANKYNLTQSEISAYMMPVSVMAFISTLLVGPFFDITGRRVMLLVTCSHLLKQTPCQAFSSSSATI